MCAPSFSPSPADASRPFTISSSIFPIADDHGRRDLHAPPSSAFDRLLVPQKSARYKELSSSAGVRHALTQRLADPPHSDDKRQQPCQSQSHPRGRFAPKSYDPLCCTGHVLSPNARPQWSCPNQRRQTWPASQNSLNRQTISAQCRPSGRLPFHPSAVAARSVDFILTDPPYIANYKSCDGRSVPNDDNDRWLAPLSRRCTACSRTIPSAQFLRRAAGRSIFPKSRTETPNDPSQLDRCRRPQGLHGRGWRMKPMPVFLPFKPASHSSDHVVGFPALSKRRRSRVPLALQPPYFCK